MYNGIISILNHQTLEYKYTSLASTRSSQFRRSCFFAYNKFVWILQLSTVYKQPPPPPLPLPSSRWWLWPQMASLPNWSHLSFAVLTRLLPLSPPPVSVLLREQRLTRQPPPSSHLQHSRNKAPSTTPMTTVFIILKTPNAFSHPLRLVNLYDQRRTLAWLRWSR